MNGRDNFLQMITEKLKEKAVSHYSYGGYLFFPDGTIRRRKGYATRAYLKENSLTTVSYPLPNEDTVVDLDSMDMFLLADLLNDLSNGVKTGEYIPFDGTVRAIYFREEQEKAQWERGVALLRERSFIANCVRGIDQLPCRCEVTDEFVSFTEKLGEWAKRCTAKDSPTAIKKVLGKIRFGSKRKLAKKKITV